MSSHAVTYSAFKGLIVLFIIGIRILLHNYIDEVQLPGFPEYPLSMSIWSLTGQPTSCTNPALVQVRHQ